MENCPRCQKTPDLCVCAGIQPAANRFHVLILQHPQEPDKDLGSARLAHLCLENSTLKIGLSWPNLKAALGRETQPSRWAVLYLGSGLQKAPPAAQPPTASGNKAPILHFVDKKGVPTAAPEQIEGVVVLDGTWSQAKALWWRNAWLLKLKRAILQSPRKSLYRELRREPRRECLSTIESIAETLEALGENPAVSENLRGVFAALLDRKRQALKTEKEARTPAKPQKA